MELSNSSLKHKLTLIVLMVCLLAMAMTLAVVAPPQMAMANCTPPQVSLDRREFLEMCRVCPLLNLCMWCLAHAYSETGTMNTPVDYFYQVAHSRIETLGYKFTLAGDCFHTKPWLKPKLVLLARNKPQEDILQYCQGSDGSTKSGRYNNAGTCDLEYY